MDHPRHRRHALLPLTVAVASIGLVGCGGDGEAVPVPGADDVVTAPAPSIDVPQAAEPTNTDATPATDAATTTSAPATTEAPAAATTAAPETTAAPPATEPADDDVFLRLGDEGPEVETMQSKLASIDYLGTGFDPGVFDETTRLGLRQFQADYGLGVDGVFGPITGRALNAAVSSINAGG